MTINICLEIKHSQNFGTKIKHRKIFPSLLYGKKGIKKEELQVVHSIRLLDQLTFAKTFNAGNLNETLKQLYKLFEECNDGSVEIMSGTGKNNMDYIVSDMIYLHGGIKVILRVLFHPMINSKRESKTLISVPLKQSIQILCIKILHGLCVTTKNIASVVGSHQYLTDYLFVLMEEQKTFGVSSSLLEELLSANRKIVDLSKIKNAKKLIIDIHETNFPSFCRILSTAIADIDFSEERSTLISQDKEEKERSNEKSLADSNQVLLLSCPEFLKKMVKLASKQILTKFTGDATMQSLIASLRSFSDVYSLMNSIAELNSNDVSNQSLSSAANNWLPSIILTEIMHKVEILYVLTLFLCGIKKLEVQSKLGELQLIPALCDIFDSLGWNAEKNNVVANGDNCDCTPESALKIQFLRFVHSFCDHNEKRYMLLSVKELQEMKDLYVSYGTPKSNVLDKLKNKFMCHGNKGFITKIIDILKSAPANNALRFWLSRAIEGFLRGAVSSPDQTFLINRDLVKHLFEHITNDETKAKEIIQSSFDLLGEVMKFNAAAYKQFNEAVETDIQFEKFLSVMTSNIVDSNMFIRCIVLSHEKFSSGAKYNVTTCLLSGLIRKWGKKIYLMYKLITAISVDSLNQENVSCLNTVLVFLMFAYNHGTLDQYLDAFLTEEQAQKHPGLILSNLYELLLFWRKHYLQRNKDCSQLEQSSAITFDKWRKVVDVMLNENQSEKTSILHYLHPSKLNKRIHSIEFSTRDF